MELRQLEYFSKVGKLKSFTHAAEELHVSQPSITTAIHKLEDELGIRLLERSTKNVRLTVKGEIFHRRIIDVLSNIQEAVSEIQCLDKGHISFGLPPMIGSYLFPNILYEFKKMYPHLDFQVLERGSVGVRTAIEQGILEMGIIILPKHTEVLETLPLMTRQAVVCLSPEHHLAKEKKISFQQLVKEKFILLNDEYFIHQVFMEECAENNCSPEITFSSDKIETVKALVAKNLGITLVMDMIIDDEKIVRVPLAEPIYFTIGLAWKKDRILSANCKKTIDFFENYFPESNRKLS